MGRFEIFKSRSDEYWFRLIASNGVVLLRSSSGYTSKNHCLSAVERTRTTATIRGNFSKHSTPNGFYFTIKGSSGERLADSEIYVSEAACEAAIIFVMQNVKTALLSEKALL